MTKLAIKKIIISAIVILSTICGALISTFVFAKTTTATVSTSSTSASVSSSNSDAITEGTSVGRRIYDLDDLVRFRNNVNNGVDYDDCTVYLMEDIDMSEYKNSSGKQESWVPIGYGPKAGTNEPQAFKGTFEGGGYIISNLKINITDFNSVENDNDEYDTSWAVGFFGIIDDATIRNLMLRDVTVNVSDDYQVPMGIGTLVGWMINSTISECMIVDGTSTLIDGESKHDPFDPDYDSCVSGFVGLVGNNCTIKNCGVQNASINASALVSTRLLFVGGLVGCINLASNFSISNSYFNGSMNIEATVWFATVGGIVGGARAEDVSITNLQISNFFSNISSLDYVIHEVPYNSVDSGLSVNLIYGGCIYIEYEFASTSAHIIFHNMSFLNNSKVKFDGDITEVCRQNYTDISYLLPASLTFTINDLKPASEDLYNQLQGTQVDDVKVVPEFYEDIGWDYNISNLAEPENYYLWFYPPFENCYLPVQRVFCELVTIQFCDNRLTSDLFYNTGALNIISWENNHKPYLDIGTDYGYVNWISHSQGEEYSTIELLLPRFLTVDDFVEVFVRDNQEDVEIYKIWETADGDIFESELNRIVEKDENPTITIEIAETIDDIRVMIDEDDGNSDFSLTYNDAESSENNYVYSIVNTSTLRRSGVTFTITYTIEVVSGFRIDNEDYNNNDCVFTLTNPYGYFYRFNVIPGSNIFQALPNGGVPAGNYSVTAEIVDYEIIASNNKRYTLTDYDWGYSDLHRRSSSDYYHDTPLHSLSDVRGGALYSNNIPWIYVEPILFEFEPVEFQVYVNLDEECGSVDPNPITFNPINGTIDITQTYNKADNNSITGYQVVNGSNTYKNSIEIFP